jgi:catechol 2,3-dioxygenase-like lactoylglutathione lyase family enzyme
VGGEQHPVVPLQAPPPGHVGLPLLSNWHWSAFTGHEGGAQQPVGSLHAEPLAQTAWPDALRVHCRLGTEQVGMQQPVATSHAPPPAQVPPPSADAWHCRALESAHVGSRGRETAWGPTGCSLVDPHGVSIEASPT